MNQFLQAYVNHVPRFENEKANALARLAASLTLLDEREIQITFGERHMLASALARFDETEETNVVFVFEVEEEVEWDNLLLSISNMVFYPLTQRKGRCEMVHI